MSYDHWKTTEPDTGDPADLCPSCLRFYSDCTCGDPDELEAALHAPPELGAIEITRRDGTKYFAKRLPCGCVGECDPYAHDTAWDWHGEVDYQ